MSEPHQFQPKRDRFAGVVPTLGSLVVTLGVFVAIPLTHGKLADRELPVEARTESLVVTPDFFDPPPPPPPPPDDRKELSDEDVIEPWDDGLGEVDGPAGVAGLGNRTLPPPPPKPTGFDRPDQSPVPVHKPSPRYPRQLLGSRTEGRLLVECHVDMSGVVRRVALRKGSGESALDESALKALKTWRFRPAVKNGRRVASIAVIPVIFQASSAE